MNFFISIFLMLGITPNYRAEYRLTYHPDSTNYKNVKEELFYLTLKENKQSYFASEKFLKADSIKGLRNAGLLSASEYMGDPKYRFHSAFMKFISKSYDSQDSQIFETISINQFKYSVKNHLKWEIGTETDSISGLVCTKATTTFAGRDYIAWFAAEIPISDGPYLFWGLPGLIIKVSDTDNDYDFTLQQFGQYKGSILEWPEHATARKTMDTNAKKVFDYREEVRKDPMPEIERHFGVVTFNGVPSTDKSLRNRKAWNNNPLELEAPEE